MAELLQSFATLDKTPVCLLASGEHTADVPLMTHELCQQYMHLALVHTILEAQLEQKLVGLLEGYHEVAEETRVARQLAEDQVGVASHLFLVLGLFGLHEVLNFSKALVEEAEAAGPLFFLSSSGVDALFLLVSLSTFYALCDLLNLDLDVHLNTLAPGFDIAPYSVVPNVVSHQSAPLVVNEVNEAA